MKGKSKRLLAVLIALMLLLTQAAYAEAPDDAAGEPEGGYEEIVPEEPAGEPEPSEDPEDPDALGEDDREDPDAPGWDSLAAQGFDTDNSYAQRAEFVIRSGDDDAEVGEGGVNLTSTGLDLHGLVSGRAQSVYLRFAGVDLPEDASITAAYLSFIMRDPSTQSTEIEIAGELGDGAAFSADAGTYDARAFTEGSVRMQTPLLGSNEVFSTADISDLIGEMRAAGTQSDFVFRIDGSRTGSFVARSFNSRAASAPMLVIEYQSERATFETLLTDIYDDAVEYGPNRTVEMNGRMGIGGYRAVSLTEANKQVSAFRVPAVELPENALIEDAYFEFTAYAAGSAGNVSNMQVSIELGEPARYQAVRGDISGRVYGGLAVNYRQEAFESRYQIIRTPNLRNIIEELRLTGWQSGGAMAFLFDGDQYTGTVYQAGSTHPPRFVIKYRYGGGDAGIGDPDDPELQENLCINEAAPAGTAQSGDAWLELYNGNDVAVTTDGLCITDDMNEPEKYPLNGMLIPAGGHRALAMGNLGSSGTLFLVRTGDGEAVVLDEFGLEPVAYNETIGRFDDASPHLVLFDGGTYAATNASATPRLRYTVDNVTGTYDGPIEVRVETDSVNTVRYTLDGTDPGRGAGLVCDGPISIGESATLKLIVYNDRQDSGVLSYRYLIGTEAMRPGSRRFAVNTGNDDAEVGSSVNLTSSGLDLHGLRGSVPQDTYLRFEGVSLPADAVVTGAYLVFTARDASSAPTELTITGELGAGAPFTSSVASFTGRLFTEASVSVTTPPVLRAGDVFQTTDIAPLVNEMRALDEGLRDYVFKIQGSRTGSCIVRSYNSSADYAPALVLEYYSGCDELSAQITSANDDAEEYGVNKTIDRNSRMEIGGYLGTAKTPANKVVSAFRFADVSLPEDAEIVDAYLEFTTYATAAAANVSHMSIRTELGDAAAYTATRGDISARSYSVLSTDYVQSGFTARGLRIRTPNLRNIIDEARLMGWRDGQSLAFLVDGDNYIGSVYQGGSAYPPRLVIQYRYGDGPSIQDALTDPADIQGVYINEISAEGTVALNDCWLELYNDNDVPVVLSDGTYLSNDKKKLTLFEFKNLMIPAKGFRVILMDKDVHLGNDHASFSLKSKGDLFLSTAQPGGVAQIDAFAYPKHEWNRTYGRITDGSPTVVEFVGESYGKSNHGAGQVYYPVEVSHDRGVYDTGFSLTVSTKPGATIRYTLDGTTPTATNGQIYFAPIPVNRSCTVKIYASDGAGNSGVLPYTYVLKSNFANETRSGVRWQYKNNITATEYAAALSELPIVAVSGDQPDLTADGYVISSWEYIDAHINPGADNFFGSTGAKKFGQESARRFNAGVALRFKRDYLTKKPKYDFFDPIPGDPYPAANKYGKLQLKEGQDGPERNVYGLGFNRYSEKVTNTLAAQMDKFSLDCRYVHYFYNGEYRGVKTLREDFGDTTFEVYFGDENNNYTEIRFQDGAFTTGLVEDGDGDPALLAAIRQAAKNKSLQEFKKYVDVEDFIKTQILFMFIDGEREIDGILHNDAYSGGGVKMISNINDTDGAFYNVGRTGTVSVAVAGGGGNYRYKWGDGASRRGAGGMFGAFSGDSRTDMTAGNLEFKTLVKDQVLEQIGPVSGNMQGAPGAPLSAENVRRLLRENIEELDMVYRVDAAFLGFSSTAYQKWVDIQPQILEQVSDRVSHSLLMWKQYGMTHTLGAVEVAEGQDGYLLEGPAGADVYYTTDGSDPMGPDGVVSSSAVRYRAGMVIPAGTSLFVRAYTAGNWGPKSFS